MINVLDFRQMKIERRKISMVTAYDYWSAKIVDKSDIDCVLVGDSAAMVMHGYPSTVHATTQMMSMHIRAVARGLAKKFLIGDMPFLSFRKGVAPAMECVDELMKAGAHAVKLEGAWGHEEIIRTITQSGIPVMGHIGLTPQSIHQFGGFRVQGRDERAANDLIAQAKRLEELGCFSVVLECVPAPVASAITDSLSIPTIGIGAGLDVDGQVLVLQDLLGMDLSFKPKFLKHFLEGESDISGALNRFHSEVQDKTFPTKSESYT
ncbi:MAG: 3-methyl-2-oxobutanoate hydroxymethyltransferase [Bdellovibrionota bacterium]